MPPHWCDNCAKNVRTDNQEGKLCCKLCGRVLAEDNFAEEVQFVKSADGQSRMAGNFVRSAQAHSESRERTRNEAYYGIEGIMYALGIDGGESIANKALRLYDLALDKNFTRGRRREQVQAACLYIVCRAESKPYLLIDFSEHLRINVYVLGAVFLQLCKIFSLEENPLIQKLVDPSLFIHRFSDRLFRGSNQNVSKTALLIVASMKRDWMQTGRKPSGLCGAALYISALAHGLNCSKSEINEANESLALYLFHGNFTHNRNAGCPKCPAIKAVHVCEATLTKRLIEFENTESGCLTIEEFEEKSKEFEKKAQEFGKDELEMKSKNGELLCIHKGAGIPQFAYGLCEDCYKEFMVISGGLNGGSEPPAFQRAERKRIMAEEAAADRSENLDSSTLPSSTEANSKLLNSNEKRSIKNTIQSDVTQTAHPDTTGATLPSKTIHDTINDRTDASDFTMEESESLSDIDDFEVDVYINTEEEKNLKTTVWEEINREYLEEQAAKEAAALAAKKAFEANFANCSGDVESARELAAAAAAAAAQNRKEKRQKRAAELKNLEPPETTAGAVKQMLDKKRLSSRIRYEVLHELIDQDESSPKKKLKEAEAEAEAEAEVEDNYEDPELDVTEDAYTNYEDDYNYSEGYNDMDDF